METTEDGECKGGVVLDGGKTMQAGGKGRRGLDEWNTVRAGGEEIRWKECEFKKRSEEHWVAAARDKRKMNGE